MNEPASQADFDEWQTMVKQEDREAFNRLVAPCLEDLQQAATRDLRYYTSLGDLRPGQWEPQELVDEALINAWRYKSRRPREIRLKAWLLSVQHRTLERWIQQNKKEPEKISIEGSPRAEWDDTEEEFWEWYQPDDFQHWEDLIPAEMPSPETAVAEEEGKEETPEEYHIRTLFHGHALPAHEIAFILRQSVRHVISVLK